MAKAPQIPIIKTQTTWTVASVLAAIDLHEKGDFSRSALLADFYTRDERIAGATNDRISALAGEDSAPFEFEVSDVDVASSASVIVDLEAFWFDLMTDQWLRATDWDLVHMGLSISHVQWETNESEWRPVKLTRMHLSAVKWSDSDDCYILRRREGDPIKVKRGDPNWLITEPDGERSWMSGAVRSLGIKFLMRDWNFRDIARYCERHGMSIMRIYEPTGSQDEAQKNVFFEQLKRMGSDGIARLPRGDDDSENYDIDFLEAKAKTSDVFFESAELLNNAIAIRILGQNLSSENNGGSYAATGWHVRVKVSIVRGDASGISSSLRELVKSYATFNYTNFDLKAAPWPRWRLVLPEDLQAQAVVMQTAGQGLTSMLQSGMPVDLVAFGNKFGVPLTEGAESATITVESNNEPSN